MAIEQKVNSVPLENLLAQVKSWSGLSRKTLCDLFETIQQRKTSSRTAALTTPSNLKRVFVILFCALALLCYGNFNTHSTWPSQWIGTLLGIGDTEKCLISMPVDPKNTFRPPVDCSFCRNVHQVDTVHRITPEEFESTYAYSGRPVLVKDALANWTASSVFSYEFFQDLYLQTSPGGRSRRCQFFPYKTEFHSLSEALSMSSERRSLPWYFGWSNCDSETADILRRHYARPYFLPERSESSRTDWIFMGTAGLGAHMHVDHVSLPSWQAQVRGSKLWSLEPPPECFYQCQPMEVVVHPGDTIVLDTNIWYHKTNVISDEISITIGSEYD